MQKARGHTVLKHSASTACRLTVSVSISLPSRGSFHLSLTVLVHYRSSVKYLALEDGPPRFPQGFTCPVVLRISLGPRYISRTGLSPSMVSLSMLFRYISKVPCRAPTTPCRQAGMVWAYPRSLAATYGISIDFFSCGY
jgi:hypothetical protein